MADHNHRNAQKYGRKCRPASGTGGDGSLACSADTLLEALVRDGRGSKRTSQPKEKNHDYAN
jgi:hypothetical protein